MAREVSRCRPLLGYIDAAKQNVNQLAVYINGTRICLYVNAEAQWIMPAVVQKLRKVVDRNHEIVNQEEVPQQLREEKGFFLICFCRWFLLP